MPCPFQWLVITDGTTNDAGIRNQVDLLSPEGFCLLEEGDWRPAITQPKGGGTWKDSALADGRRPADFKMENVVEQMTLTVTSLDQDQLIRDTQELRRLLNKARTYSATDWQTEPVWIEAQGNGETNMRYAIVWDWRTPNDGNPYEEPFWQRLARAGMDDFTLTLEREPYWRADEPGNGTCAEIGVSKVYDGGPPYYLEYNGTSPAGSSVNVPDAAALQNLPAADFTLDGWWKADTYGFGGNAFAFSKENGAFATGYHVESSAAVGLEFKIDFATTDMRYSTGIDDWAPDGEFHYLAFVFDSATKTARIWVDTQEVASYLLSQPGVGAYSGDIGDDIYIGNIAAGSRTWDGEIGWIRLSTGKLHSTATITLPTASECELPVIVAATVGQWIGFEGSGAAIRDQDIAAGNDGTQANCTFGECGMSYGNTDGDTCDDEVYIANKQNVANITHIIYYDSAAATWSVNKQGTALPYNLFDAAVIANDAVYFGIETGIPDSGPFASLVFDIGTLLDVAGTWEYWNGAWVALTVQDNTNQNGVATGTAFDTAGVGSVHWVPPPDWTTNDPGMGITGYWVRYRITGVATANPPPTQQNRDVYTIVWPYVELASDEVLGDVTALMRLKIRNQSDTDHGTGGVTADAQRIVGGTRSLTRGEDFTAFINLADEQNPTGITIALGGGAFTTDPGAPSGRMVLYNNAPVAETSVCYVSIVPPLSIEYGGKYHVFARGQQLNGAAGDINLRIDGRYGSSTLFWESDTLQFVNLNDWQLLDFGQVTLPSSSGSRPISSFYFTFYATGNTTTDFKLYDFILMPVDEFAFDTLNAVPEVTGLGKIGFRLSPSAYNAYLDLDPISIPKKTESLVVIYANDYWRARWLYISPSVPQLQANVAQRVWFLETRYVGTSTTDIRSDLVISHSVRMEKVERYFSMRGDR